MPANKQLTDYLSSGLSQGHDINVLRNQLLQSGWPQQDVEDSIAAVSGHGHGMPPRQPPRPAAHGEMGLFRRFEMALFHTKEFFTAIKGEEGCGKAFKYYMVFCIFIIINSVLSQPPETFIFFSLLVPGNLLVLMVLLAVYIFGLAAIFVSALIQHIGVIIFGGKAGYYQTFKAIVYGGTSPQVIGTIPILILYVTDTLGLLPEMISTYVTLLYMSILVLFGLWGFYISARGISELHDVSLLRAIGMLLLIPLVLAIISVAGSVWAYMSLASYMGGIAAGGIQVIDSYCTGDTTATIVVTNTGDYAVDVDDIKIKDISTGSEVSGTWRDSDGNSLQSLPLNEIGIWSGTCSDSPCRYTVRRETGRVQAVTIPC